MQQYILSCNHCPGLLKPARCLVQTNSQPKNKENSRLVVLEGSLKLLRLSSSHVSLKRCEDPSFLTYFWHLTTVNRLHAVTQLSGLKRHAKNKQTKKNKTTKHELLTGCLFGARPANWASLRGERGFPIIHRFSVDESAIRTTQNCMRFSLALKYSKVFRYA